MKNWVKLVVILIAIIKSNLLIGQSISETFNIANKAFEDKKFSTAVNLYERVLFFDTASKYADKIYGNLAKAYQQNSEFEKAAYYFDLAYFEADDKGVQKNYWLIEKAKCGIRLNDYSMVLTEAYYLETEDKTIKDQQSLLIAIAQFNLNNSEESFEKFEDLCPNSNCISDLTLLRKEVEHLNRKSPKRARILSMIFPGLGYYYIGEWKKGLNSTLLVGGLGSLLIVNSIQTGFINSFFNIMPRYQRYFMGGYTNAEIVAQKKLNQAKLKVLDDVLILLKDDYKIDL
jgi:tetratricopeptide (TPR) repeat protein